MERIRPNGYRTGLATWRSTIRWRICGSSSARGTRGERLGRGPGPLPLQLEASLGVGEAAPEGRIARQRGARGGGRGTGRLPARLPWVVDEDGRTGTRGGTREGAERSGEPAIQPSERTEVVGEAIEDSRGCRLQSSRGALCRNGETTRLGRAFESTWL